MSVAGFFILLGIAIVLKWAGNRLVPLLIPGGRLKIVGAGWLGALAGSLLDRAFWRLGPEVSEIYITAAFAGCVVVYLVLGIAPFIRIMLGKT